jgi:RNA polymerase sigma-70 factor (ECF subfamily)
MAAGVVSTARIQSGLGSFADVCRLHGPAIHAYLSRRAGTTAANDLFGEVWVQAYSSRATYDPERGAPLPWLYGIARHVLRAHWRSAGRAEKTLEAAATDPWSDVDERLDAGSQLDEMRTALTQLTPEEREVLLLVAWEHLTPSEAAESLGIPAGTARSRLHRARHLMQSALAAVPTTVMTEKEHQ